MYVAQSLPPQKVMLAYRHLGAAALSSISAQGGLQVQVVKLVQLLMKYYADFCQKLAKTEWTATVGFALGFPPREQEFDIAISDETIRTQAHVCPRNVPQQQ
jgi:hypothetical protein